LARAFNGTLISLVGKLFLTSSTEPLQLTMRNVLALACAACLSHVYSESFVGVNQSVVQEHAEKRFDLVKVLAALLLAFNPAAASFSCPGPILSPPAGDRRFVGSCSLVLDRPIRWPHRQAMMSLSNKWQKSPSADWSFVDAAYLITCPSSDGRNPRLDAAWRQLQAIGLDSKTEVCEFSTDDEDRVRGCYMSHISVLEKAASHFASRDRSEGLNILVLEDNLSISPRIAQDTLDSVADFFLHSRQNNDGVGIKEWDMVHLAYNMYVPGLSVKRIPKESHVIQLRCNANSALGTTAYMISRSGLDRLLSEHRRTGYIPGDAIPNLMARLFPKSRYAAFPMPLHRSAEIKSLVNSQLDTLRSMIYRPQVYTNWERALVGTGLSTNVLFPALVFLLLAGTLAGWGDAIPAFLAAARGETVSFGSDIALDVQSLLSVCRIGVSAGCLAILGYGLALAPRPQEADVHRSIEQEQQAG